jgi:hypothetical protein
MGKRWMQLSAGLAMVVLCISTCAITSNAAGNWSEDFEEGPLDDWTLFGWESMDSPVTIEGNFSAVSHMLEVLDDDLNVARHSSNVTVGTWSFDMFVPEDDYGFIRVEFMSNGASLEAHGNMSWVAFSAWFYGTEPLFYFLYGTESSKHLLKTIDKPLAGWHHIEVSRNSDNRFLLTLNGTLEANVTSTLVTSSTYFQVLCNNVTGAAIDNIVVEEPIPTTTPTPTPTTPPPDSPLWILITVGGGVVVAVIVLAIIFLRRR